jgi:cell division protein FtsX
VTQDLISTLRKLSGIVTVIDERSESLWRRATLFAKIAVVGIALLCLVVIGTILYVHFTTPHPAGD